MGHYLQMSILEKWNPQKFLFSVYLCVLRGELFFYHRGSQRFFVFSPWVKVFYHRGDEHKEIAKYHITGNIS